MNRILDILALCIGAVAALIFALILMSLPYIVAGLGLGLGAWFAWSWMA